MEGTDGKPTSPVDELIVSYATQNALHEQLRMRGQARSMLKASDNDHRTHHDDPVSLHDCEREI